MSDHIEHDAQRLPDLPAEPAKDDAEVKGGFNPQPEPPGRLGYTAPPEPDRLQLPAVQRPL
jgi:hypothetical protein